MSKRKLTYKDFLNYFRNHLQNKEKHAFEKEIMQDAFEEEAFDGLSKLSEDELEQDILDLKSGIDNKTRKSNRIIPVWFRYAASVIILVGIGFSIFYLNSRFWQESMLKEQVSQEMDAADSMVVEVEKRTMTFEVDTDSILEEPNQYLAEGKGRSEKSEKIESEDEIVVDQTEFYDADMSETEILSDDDVFKVMEEIDKEEEMVVEDDRFLEEIALKEKEAKPVKIEEQELKNVSQEQEIAQALEGEVSGVKIRGNAKAPKSAKKSEEQIIEADQGKRIIKGKIVSADDDLSIPGVSIALKDNPNIGTTTDIDGEFQLTLPPGDEELKTLIASFVGMRSQEIAIEQDTNLLVYMEPEVMALDEVVVSGYGKNQQTAEESPILSSAQPPGSISKSKYKKLVLENLDYSELSDFQGKYRIKISFDVGEDGSLSNFTFKNVPGIHFSNEIKNVIVGLGNWIPAKEDDYNVSSSVKFTIKVEIE